MGLNFENINYQIGKKRNPVNKKFNKKKFKKIFSVTGIKNTFSAMENEDIISMSIQACKKIVNSKNVNKIDALILITQTPKYNIPSNSFVIHSILKLKKNCLVFDVNHGCSGYIYGLNLAHSLLVNNKLKNVLLITADMYSKYSKSLKVSSIFSDSATATLMSYNENKMIDFYYNNDSDNYNLLMQKKNNYLSSIDENELVMQGEEIFKFTMKNLPETIETFLKKKKIRLSNINYFIFHQASKIILDNIIRKLNLDDKKCFNYVGQYGNTVSSSIPIILSKSIKKKIKKNKLILLCGFGVGLSVGVALIET